jgi:hypothetical protein
MPPGPAYNFLCVLSSVADILSNAARIRAAQTAASTTVITSAKRKRRKLDLEANVDARKFENAQSPSANLARKEKAIQKGASVHQSDFSGYPVTYTRSLSDFLSSSELPEDRVYTYEHAPKKSIPESHPREDFLEGTLSPDDILPKAFEPHEVNV